jgi:hypothetical protein
MYLARMNDVAEETIYFYYRSSEHVALEEISSHRHLELRPYIVHPLYAKYVLNSQKSNKLHVQANDQSDTEGINTHEQEQEIIS